MSDFFPFTLRGASYHNGNFGGGIYKFKEVFNKNRPETIEIVETFGTFIHKRTEKFCYYCFDVVVNSPTSIEFICYDMEDYVYGGRGKEYHRFTAKCPKSLTKEYIDSRLFLRGIQRREKEIMDKEDTLYSIYAEEERKTLGL